MIKSKKKMEVIIQILSIVFIISFFLTFCLINIFHTKAALFADTTQTAIGARVFWENKSLSPENWYAWSESGVFSLATIGALIYGITGSLIWTQSISPVISSVFVMLSVIYFFKSIKISVTEQIIGLFLVLCLPWGIYPQSMAFLYYAAYSLCIATAFFQIGVFIKLISNQLKYKKTVLFITAILAFVQGLNSSRAMLVVYTPLVLLASYRLLLVFIKNFKEKNIDIVNEVKIWSYTFFIALVGYMATRMPWSNRTQMSKALRNSPIKLVKNVVPAMLDWIGIDQSTFILVKIFSIVLLLVTVVVLFRIIARLEIESLLTLGFLFFIISVSLTIFMLSITQTEVAQRYFFMLPYVFALTVLILIKKIRELPDFYYLGIMIMIFVYAYFNMSINFMPILNDKNIDESKEAVIEWMIQNKYDYGYTSYVDANSFTIYSDGQIQVSAVDLNNLQIHKWVTDPKWYYPNLPFEMKTAYIIDKAEIDQYESNLLNYRGMSIVHETEKYVIFSSDYNYTNHAE